MVNVAWISADGIAGNRLMVSTPEGTCIGGPE